MTGPDLGNDIQVVQLRADPLSDEITLGTITDDSHLELTLWTGSSWGTPNHVETSSSDLDCEPSMVDPRPGAVTWSWVYPASGSVGGIYSSPIIRSGRVYVGSDDSKLYCLNASTGSVIWTYTAISLIRSSPSAVYEDNKWTIYFAAPGYVYAVIDTGSSYQEKWKVLLSLSDIRGSPMVMDSLLYIGSLDDTLYCLRTSNGTKKWKTYLSGDIYSSTSVYNNTVYAGSYSDTLYALNGTDGTILRRYKTCGDLAAPAFLTWTTGLLCIGTYASATPGSDTMYVINSSNFTPYWKFADSGNLARVWTSCFSLDDQKLYFGSDNDNLYCMNLSTQTSLYKYNTGSDVLSSPLAWNAVVYFGSNSGGFYGLDDSAQKPRPKWPFFTNGTVISSPAISLTSNLVAVGSSDGHVYAFTLE